MIITNLLTNMVVVLATGTLSTNYSSKPAFHDYVYNATFQEASNLIVAWNLDVARPVTTNMVSFFGTRACADGINGMISFNRRYLFGWGQGKLDYFEDQVYSEQRIVTDNAETNDLILEQWMRATNLLTMEKARVIAESALSSVGIPMDNRKFRAPAQMTQKQYEWKDGKTYPEPLYRFRWDANDIWYNYEIQVSGITSNVL